MLFKKKIKFLKNTKHVCIKLLFIINIRLCYIITDFNIILLAKTIRILGWDNVLLFNFTVLSTML